MARRRTQSREAGPRLSATQFRQLNQRLQGEKVRADIDSAEARGRFEQQALGGGIGADDPLNQEVAEAEARSLQAGRNIRFLRGRERGDFDNLTQDEAMLLSSDPTEEAVTRQRAGERRLSTSKPKDKSAYRDELNYWTDTYRGLGDDEFSMMEKAGTVDLYRNLFENTLSKKQGRQEKRKNILDALSKFNAIDSERKIDDIQIKDDIITFKTDQGDRQINKAQIEGILNTANERSIERRRGEQARLVQAERDQKREDTARAQRLEQEMDERFKAQQAQADADAKFEAEENKSLIKEYKDRFRRLSSQYKNAEGDLDDKKSPKYKIKEEMDKALFERGKVDPAFKRANFEELKRIREFYTKKK
jgi:hypothetical protein